MGIFGCPYGPTTFGLKKNQRVFRSEDGKIIVRRFSKKAFEKLEEEIFLDEIYPGYKLASCNVHDKLGYAIATFEKIEES